MRRKINIQRFIERENEYDRKFGQLARYEMRDNNISWREAKQVVRFNLIFSMIKYEIAKR